MDYGFVFDNTFNLSWQQQRDLARRAFDLGYTSGWAPGGVNSRDGILTAVQWAQAAPGLTTGTSVTVAPFWTPTSLASQAATKDGRLDFVCVREEDRSLCMEYLDARLAGRRAKFPLPLRRFRELKIVWENSMLHFDDKVWPRKKQKAKSPSDIEITVKPSALVILQHAKQKSAR